MNPILRRILRPYWPLAETIIRKILVLQNREICKRVRRPEEARSLLPHFNRKGVVIDVGSGNGEYIDAVFSSFPDVFVHSVEANPLIFHQLQINFGGRKNIGVYNVGLWNRPCARDLFVYGFPSTSSFYRVNGNRNHVQPKFVETLPIPCTTLDDFCHQHDIQRISLLHVDANGAEWDILSGATGVLENNQVQYVELVGFVGPIYSSENSFIKSLAVLSGYGFGIEHFYSESINLELNRVTVILRGA